MLQVHWLIDRDISAIGEFEGSSSVVLSKHKAELMIPKSKHFFLTPRESN